MNFARLIVQYLTPCSLSVHVYARTREAESMAAFVRLFKTVRRVLFVRRYGSVNGTCSCAVVTRSTVLSKAVTVFDCRAVRSITNRHAKLLEDVDYSRQVTVTRARESTVMSYNAVWLRENCRCDSCYVTATWQRAVVYHRLPPEAFVANHVTCTNEDVVEVTWADGHLSRYNSLYSWYLRFSFRLNRAVALNSKLKRQNRQQRCPWQLRIHNIIGLYLYSLPCSLVSC